MAILTHRTIRYARAWLTGPEACVEDEIMLDRDGTPVPATVVRPSGRTGPLPGWVIMHGITRPGREHEQLVRFTRTLASCGLVAIVPDVPEWRDLHLAPHLSEPTIKAAIAGLRTTGVARDDPVGVVGFSFGAPHAIAAAGSASLRDEIGGAVGFGGYCALESTFRFMMTGVHSWNGQEHFLEPDPYGRWIVAANYLTSVPGHESAGDVANALSELATHAGDTGAPSWDPSYDPKIRQLREHVDESRRHVFDLFALPTNMPSDRKSALQMAEDLTAAALQNDPLFDVSTPLQAVDRPVHILHGRRDHLIPFTEALRFRKALAGTVSRVTVTRLFGHSAQDRFPLFHALWEVPKFARALSGMLAVV